MGTVELLCGHGDLLLTVLEFLRVPDQRPRPPHRDHKRKLRDLVALGYTNQFFHRLLFVDGESTDIADKDGGVRCHSRVDLLFGTSGKRYWKNVHALEELVTNRIPLPTGKTQKSSLPFPSLQILTHQRETDSLRFYTEGRRNPEAGKPCSGYFGFEVLSNGEVAVWGDFSGLAFYSNADAFLAPPRDEGGGGATRDDACGESPQGRGGCRDHRPYGSMFSSYRLQVMAVLVHDERVFLGFANGDIDCVRLPLPRGARAPARGRGAAAPAEEEEYPYVSGSSDQHRNEVTSLVAVRSRHLASGSLLSSDVLVHWNALSDGDLTGPASRVHYDVESVMVIASTSLSFDPFESSSLVAIGSSDGTIFYSCWEACTEQEERTREEWLMSHDRLLMPPEVEGHVSSLAFFEEQLVIGTNTGSLVVMNKDILLDGHRYTLQDCCGAGKGSERAGCVVEDVKLIGGNVLLTAGGFHGDIRFWDYETGQALCRWKIHPGRTVGGSVLRSCVVAVHVCHERASLVALCQDGFVRECRLDELVSWSKSAPSLVPRKKKKKSNAMMAWTHPNEKRARSN